MNILSQNSDAGAPTITQELDLYEKSSILYTEWRNLQNYSKEKFSEIRKIYLYVTYDSYGIPMYDNLEKTLKNVDNHTIINDFYNEHRSTFPKIYNVVQRLINLPPSSSNIERTFSQFGHVLTAPRNRLQPQTVLQLQQSANIDNL